jgi:hypothetical protein
MSNYRHPAEADAPTAFLCFLLAVASAITLLAYGSVGDGHHYPETLIQGDFTVECDSSRSDGDCTVFWRKGRAGRLCKSSLSIPTDN